MDTTIEPGVRIGGHTTIGEDVLIGQYLKLIIVRFIRMLTSNNPSSTTQL